MTDGDFGFSFEELESLGFNEDDLEVSEIKYKCIPANFTSSDGKHTVDFLMTDDVDTARIFADIDEFTDATMFLIPEGLEVTNEYVLQKITLKLEDYAKKDFNTLYITAMLTS